MRMAVSGAHQREPAERVPCDGYSSGLVCPAMSAPVLIPYFLSEAAVSWRVAASMAFCVLAGAAATWLASWWVSLAGAALAYGLYRLFSRPQGHFELLRRKGRLYLRSASSKAPLSDHGYVSTLDFRWSYNHYDARVPSSGRDPLEGRYGAPANELQLRLDILLEKGTRLTLLEPLGNWAPTPHDFAYLHFAPAVGERVLFAATGLPALRRAMLKADLLPTSDQQFGM